MCSRVVCLQFKPPQSASLPLWPYPHTLGRPSPPHTAPLLLGVLTPRPILGHSGPRDLSRRREGHQEAPKSAGQLGGCNQQRDRGTERAEHPAGFK